MKKLVLLAAVAALSACSQKAEEPAPAASDTAMAGEMAGPTDGATWTPALPAAGKYTVTGADGKTTETVEINADNSYSRQPTEGLAEAGIVKLEGGKVCFDPAGDTRPVRCYVESVRAADGSFTATDDKGVVATVKPAA